MVHLLRLATLLVFILNFISCGGSTSESQPISQTTDTPKAPIVTAEINFYPAELVDPSILERIDIPPIQDDLDRLEQNKENITAHRACFLYYHKNYLDFISNTGEASDYPHRTVNEIQNAYFKLIYYHARFLLNLDNEFSLYTGLLPAVMHQMHEVPTQESNVTELVAILKQKALEYPEILLYRRILQQYFSMIYDSTDDVQQELSFMDVPEDVWREKKELGFMALIHDEYDKAKQLLSEALVLAPPEGKVYIEVNLGEVMYRLKEYDAAMQYINEALELMEIHLEEEWEQSKIIHDANTIMGLVMLDQNHVEEALGYLKKSFKIEEPVPSLISFGPKNELVQAFIDRNEYATVLDCIDAALGFIDVESTRADWIKLREEVVRKMDESEM
jgi:tetratricopeptide (TPR) repeat protein